MVVHRFVNMVDITIIVKNVPVPGFVHTANESLVVKIVKEYD